MLCFLNDQYTGTLFDKDAQRAAAFLVSTKTAVIDETAYKRYAFTQEQRMKNNRRLAMIHRSTLMRGLNRYKHIHTFKFHMKRS